MWWRTFVFPSAVLIGLMLSGSDALASVMASASVTASGLTITQDSGSVLITDGSGNTASLGSSAALALMQSDASAGNVFDSFGSNGNFNSGDGTGTGLVSATSPGGYATGTAIVTGSTSVASVSLTASAALNIPAGSIAAGVTGSGAFADLFGAFELTCSSACPSTVNVTFGVSLAEDLDAVADAMGSILTDDAAMSLTLFDSAGDIPLFSSVTLPGLPITDSSASLSAAPTLSNSIALDPTQTYFFDLNVTAEVNAVNVPEPGTLSLMFASIGMVAWRRRVRRPPTVVR